VNDACINAHLPKVWSDIELNGVHNAFDEWAAPVHETAAVADIGKPDGVTSGAPRNVDQYQEPRLATLLWSTSPVEASCGDHQETLSVATLNAWGLPSPVASDRRGRMPLIAKWLQDRRYDVAGLEEMWKGALRLFHVPGLTTPDRDVDSGLALMTKYQVREKQLHTYSAEVGFDRLKSKGVLSADLDVDGKMLTVAVTHLQAGRGARAAYVRDSQVSELLRVLDRSKPTVLLGDFNMYEDQSTDARSIHRLETAGFVDVAARIGATDPTYPGLSDRFDRIYVRETQDRCLSPKSASVIDAHLSDHRAVEATIALGG